MRVVIVNYGGDFAAGMEPEAAIDALRGLTGWAEAVRGAGAEVTVVQGFDRDGRLRRAGVDYVFVAGRFTPRLSRRRLPRRLHRAVARLEPGAVHVNGLIYAISIPVPSHRFDGRKEKLRAALAEAMDKVRANL